MHWSDIAKRLGVLVVVASLVVTGAAMLPQASEGPDREQLQNAEWNRANTSVDPLPAKGGVSQHVNADPGSGVIVFDTAHVNEFSRRDIEPLVAALTQLGYTVEFTGTGSFEDSLDGADAFVVIDPGTEYDQEEVAAVKDFTDSGGRLLVLGEPNHASVSAGFGGLSVRMEESELTTLASAYNVTVETRYLYNLQTNDGNYKHILTAPTSQSRVDGVETVTMYSATTVHAKRGRPLLRTVAGTHKDESDTTGKYSVAIRRGNLLVIGDSSFLEAGRHNVADNEKFIAYLVEFLVAGETSGSGSDTGSTSDGTGTGADQSGNQTAEDPTSTS